jgi:hypothetical protein
MKKKTLIKIYTFFIIALICKMSVAQDDMSFLNPPELIKNFSSVEDYTPESRKFTGISSLAISPEGRMWAVWYTGITPGEDANNYVVVATSGDDGKTWEEVLVIDPDGPGPVRAFDPEVWVAPNGQLWVFWAQQIQPSRSTSSGVWAITTSNPETGNTQWSEPRRLVDGIMMCKPLVLSTGEWVLPVAFWHIWGECAAMVTSEDDGETWEIRGAVNVPDEVRSPEENMIVERKNGSLWMLVRTKYGIGESISFDRGYTWSPVVPSNIQHPAARFFIYRLNSGSLLLVKHGPIDMRTGRSHLMAFISKDDGHSWSNGLLLDERPGVSYPDGQQTSDGTIYITYDFNRTKDQNILITSFTEDDIKMGSDNTILEVFKRRQLISHGGTE